MAFSGPMHTMLLSPLHCAGDGSADGTTAPCTAADKVRLCTVAPMMGVAFGFALQKGRVYEPAVVRGQFALTDWTMLVMFLAAAGVSALVFAAVHAVAPEEMARLRGECSTWRPLSMWAGVGGGAFLLGIGMYLAGACPGMVLAQVGAGVPNSGLTIVGALFGAAAFGLAHPSLRAMLPAQAAAGGACAGAAEAAVATASAPPTQLLDASLKQPFPRLALLLGAVLLAVAVAVQTAAGIRAPCDASDALACTAWLPLVAGSVIGALQLPAIAAFGDTIGSATAYLTVVSQALSLTDGATQARFKYMADKRFGVGNLWQVIYVCSAISGAALSKAAGGTLGAVLGVSPVAAFLGGALMLFGARMAGGCTSGHGLSGMGMLSLASLLAVPAMFSGGILAAFVAKGCGW